MEFWTHFLDWGIVGVVLLELAVVLGFRIYSVIRGGDR